MCIWVLLGLLRKLAEASHVQSVPRHQQQCRAQIHSLLCKIQKPPQLLRHGKGHRFCLRSFKVFNLDPFCNKWSPSAFRSILRPSTWSILCVVRHAHNFILFSCYCPRRHSTALDASVAMLERSRPKFYEEAVWELLKARTILCASYVYGYFHLEKTSKSWFELMQHELEDTTEKLSEMLQRPHLRTPKRLLMQASHSVLQKRSDFLKAVYNGLQFEDPWMNRNELHSGKWTKTLSYPNKYDCLFAVAFSRECNCIWEAHWDSRIVSCQIWQIWFSFIYLDLCLVLA